jgi:hypothetical protein
MSCASCAASLAPGAFLPTVLQFQHQRRLRKSKWRCH